MEEAEGVERACDTAGDEATVRAKDWHLMVERRNSTGRWRWRMCMGKAQERKGSPGSVVMIERSLLGEAVNCLHA